MSAPAKRSETPTFTEMAHGPSDRPTATSRPTRSAPPKADEPSWQAFFRMTLPGNTGSRPNHREAMMAERSGYRSRGAKR